MRSCQCQTSSWAVSSSLKVVSSGTGTGAVPKKTRLPLRENLTSPFSLTVQRGFIPAVSVSTTRTALSCPAVHQCRVKYRCFAFEVSRSARNAACVPASSRAICVYFPLPMERVSSREVPVSNVKTPGTDAESPLVVETRNRPPVFENTYSSAKRNCHSFPVFSSRRMTGVPRSSFLAWSSSGASVPVAESFFPFRVLSAAAGFSSWYAIQPPHCSGNAKDFTLGIRVISLPPSARIPRESFGMSSAFFLSIRPFLSRG